jgi:hypothetical protein
MPYLPYCCGFKTQFAVLLRIAKTMKQDIYSFKTVKYLSLIVVKD